GFGWPTNEKRWRNLPLGAGPISEKSARLGFARMGVLCGSQGGGRSSATVGRPLICGGPMTFRLHQAESDNYSKPAYVEFRGVIGRWRDQPVVAVFTFRTKERLSKQQIPEEVVRKAGHVLKGAVSAV